MAQSWVILKGSHQKLWTFLTVSLLVIIMAIYELVHPGTMISLFHKILATITQIGGYFRDVANALRELIGDISNWLR